MDNTADKIEDFIDEHREHLSSNLRELEGRVKSATDWRVHFEKHTALAIGLAAGAGMLAGHFSNPRHSGRPLTRTLSDKTDDASQSRAPWKGEIAEQFDQVKSAMIGVAAEHLTNFVDSIVPGFKGHLERRRNR